MPSNAQAVIAPGITTQIVTEADISRQAENTAPLKAWTLFTRNAGGALFLAGPGSAPIGVGSVQFATPTGADKVTLFNYDHVGTRLDAIRALSYRTYRTAGDAFQVAALNIEVDVNGAAPGGFTTLVFEPVYNTNQGAVTSGLWQPWDAYSSGQGVWWSSNPIPSAPNRDTFVSWSALIAANPDAVIVSGFGVNQGSGNPALTTAVDALVIGHDGGTVTYDFEPFATATTRDACKNDGWKTVKKNDGSSFKNQGECVSYVNSIS